MILIRSVCKCWINCTIRSKLHINFIYCFHYCYCSDKHVFRLLNGVISTECSVTDFIRFRNDLQQRLDSSSMLGEYSAALCTASNFSLCNDTIVSNLMYCIRKFKNMEDVLLISSLLEMTTKHLPIVLKTKVNDIQDWCVSVCAQVNSGGKHVASNEIIFRRKVYF